MEASVTVRDRVVLGALGVGVLLSLLSWRLGGPWVALIVGLVALGVAALAYRIEAPRIDVDHPEAWNTRTSPTPGRVDRSSEQIDQ